MGALPRMRLYQLRYPFQYLAIVSIIFGIVGSLWIRFHGAASRDRRLYTMAAAFSIVVLISGPIGGILWHYHDMLQGYIPKDYVIWRKARWGIEWGLLYGWLLVLTAFPLNLFALFVGYISLNLLSSKSSQTH